MLLERVDTDPYTDHPELLEIWPHRRAELLRDIQDCLANPDIEQSFLIMHEGEVVGITGFYQYDDEVGLNWHGILPKYSRLGYGKKALELLIDLAKQAYPKAEYLIEEVPMNREQSICGFFQSLGFERTETMVEKPWVTHDTGWIEYRLKL